jgi:hypothetical protein
MPLAPLWKTAKTTFENTTNKKKPSATWLGNIRKSAGIDGALKAIDAAKTAADLKKALTTLSTTSAAYITLLDATAKDPKAVPLADKPAYVTAINALKAALEHIKDEGGKLETVLEGAGKKDQVNATRLKEANDFVAGRQKTIAFAGKLVQQMRGFLAQITQSAAGAAKQFEEAKKAAAQSNTMLHQVAIGVIDKYIDQAEKIAETASKQYTENIKEGGELMKYRMEDKMDDLPESISKPLKQKSNDAWRQVNAAASEMNTVKGEIEHKLAETKAYRNQAEAVGNQLRDPAEYIGELKKVLAEIEEEMKTVTLKGGRIIKANEAVTDIAKQPPDVQANWYRNNLGQSDRYEPDITVAIKKLNSLGTQANVPRGAMEDKGVAAAVMATRKAAKEGIDYAQSALLASSQLRSKILLQSQRLAKATGV